jgi:hypothetical protein
VSDYADVLEWGQGEAGDAATLWQAGQQPAAVAKLAWARQQVATAGTQASAVVRDATAVAPTSATLTASLRPMMQPDSGGDFNEWDNVVGVHPEAGAITVGDARTHILWGEPDGGGGHFFDSGMPGKTVFPENWDEDQVVNAVTEVANNPDRTPVEQPNGRFLVTGTTDDGVTMDVVVNPDGTVRTAYPTAGPGVCVNDENGDPQPLPNEKTDFDQTEEQAQGETEDQASATAEAEVTQAEAQAAAQVEAEALAEAEAEAMAEAEMLEMGDE